MTEAHARRTPRLHQGEALTGIDQTLARDDRATVIMACGTGKTLVEMWSTETIAHSRILVLMPTLALLKQVRDEWIAHNSWNGDMRTMCVCSDSDIARVKSGSRGDRFVRSLAVVKKVWRNDHHSRSSLTDHLFVNRYSGTGSEDIDA